MLLVSLKAAALGLNLTAANHVVLLDLWWNPTTEEQAIDRAHRIGQARAVHVTRVTIEGALPMPWQTHGTWQLSAAMRPQAQIAGARCVGQAHGDSHARGWQECARCTDSLAGELGGFFWSVASGRCNFLLRATAHANSGSCRGRRGPVCTLLAAKGAVMTCIDRYC